MVRSETDTCLVVQLTPSHLLITRPTESNALESFVLQRAEDSAHMAMLVSTMLTS